MIRESGYFVKIRLIVLFAALMCEIYEVHAAKCGYNGCNRYASSDGYCQLHTDYGVMQRILDKRNNSGQRTFTSSASAQLPLKYIIPQELLPTKDFDRDWSIMKVPEIWTNAKGVKVEATLTHVSQDRTKVYLTYSKNKKYVEMPVASLSSSDQKKLKNLFKQIEREGRTWRYGVFLDARGCAFMDTYERAKAMIRAKDESLSQISCLKVFQALRNNGLCTAGHKGVDGSYRCDFNQTFYYKASTESSDPIADGDLLLRSRFYWAGTFSYTTVKGEGSTVNVLTDSIQFAIDEVMRSLGWKFNADVSSDDDKGQEGGHRSGILHCTGSGFFITKNGYLVTNAHVVEGGRRFDILTSTGKFEARLVKVDSETDLAVLKIDATVVPCAFSSKRKEKLGAEIFTMGFPQPGLQGFSPKVTKGVISGQDGYRGDVREYQIDASIQPGNSGGPLLDLSGHVVGMIVASLKSGQVVNYAIKKSYLMAFLDSANCSDGIIEGSASNAVELETIVEKIRDSCVLVLNYK